MTHPYECVYQLIEYIQASQNKEATFNELVRALEDYKPGMGTTVAVKLFAVAGVPRPDEDFK